MKDKNEEQQSQMNERKDQDTADGVREDEQLKEENGISGPKKQDRKSKTSKGEKEKKKKKEKQSKGKRKKEKELEDKLQNLENEYQELYDKFIRLHADFDNFRRKSQKDLYNAKERGYSELILAILPVVDDLERALDTIKDAGEETETAKGVELVYDKFNKSLEQKGLKEMDTVGDPFDSEYHEALTKVPAPSKDMKGKVVEQVQKGYLLNGKIIRYAKVVVGE